MLTLKMHIKLQLESAHAYKHLDSINMHMCINSDSASVLLYFTFQVETNKTDMMSVFCIHKFPRNPL